MTDTVKIGIIICDRYRSCADTVHFATGLVVGYPPCPYVPLKKQGSRMIEVMTSKKVGL